MKKIGGGKMPLLKMPKPPSSKTQGSAGKTRLKRPGHSGAPSAFPSAPMAFPPTDPTGGAGMGAGGPAPDPAMGMPPSGEPGDMGQ